MKRNLVRILTIGWLVCFLVAACAPTAAAPTPTVGLVATATVAAPTPTVAKPTATQAAPTEALPTLTAAPVAGRVLKVMTHDSFAVSDAVINAFESQTGIKVQFLQTGDAGTALNKAILSKDNPLADVFYGLDNTFLSRALDEGIFETYASPALAAIPAEFKLDVQNQALPVDYGDVCLNYDKAYITDHKLPPPQNLEDLLKPDYKSLVVVENPATSSPGMAFLLATVAHYGDPGYLDYWKGLVQNDLLVVNDWGKAYNTEFTRSGGARPIVLSYNSDPAFEVINSQTPITEPPTAVMTGVDACFRQIEFVGILKGTANRDLAEKWVDFMLSTTFQEDVPLQMYVFPVNPAARLDDTFVKFMVNPAKPAFVSPQDIAANRDRWIAAWTSVVLR